MDSVEQIAALTDGAATPSPPLDPQAAADAPPQAAADAPPGGGKRKRRTPARDILIGLIDDQCELWHDASRAAYVSYQVHGHREHWPVASRTFRLWCSSEYFRATAGAAVGGSALDDALRIIEARAINDGPLYTPHVRVGRAGGVLYLDLADDDWRAVEITRDGWRVVGQPPARFLRTPSLRSLPAPELGGSVEDLRPFANVRSDGDFMLVVSWLVAALRPGGPYPIAAINGEQGSGKSFFCRLLRALVDPSAAPIRALPKDERDLHVSANNSWVLAFDNLSGLPGAMSDALCRIATGGGLATRANYTDRDETIFEASRPVMLNGIPMLTDRADLAERALTIHLKTIEEAARRAEDDLLAEFEAARPSILGALLDAVSAAERHLADVRLDKLPRLADFAKWIVAAEPGLGWPPGAFLTAFADNRREVAEASFEADVVAVAIRDFVTAAAFPDGWHGNATKLLADLNGRVSEAVRKSRRWPMTATAMGSAVTRASPVLRSKGFVIERFHSGATSITIVPPRGEPAGAAAGMPAPLDDAVPL
ncbi:MAG TPA: hypothetical protein VFA57_12185 [Pseudolabrys sp.]|nr:hypothetical protein [Pseudolabrys sp.]